TPQGALDLLCESVRIARDGDCERLIVKTTAEAHRIPTIEENVEALELAARHWNRLGEDADAVPDSADPAGHEDSIFEAAQSLVAAVLTLHADVGEGVRRAFEKGYLDVPFCLHRDNANQTRPTVADDGSLQWARLGRLPIRPARFVPDAAPLNPQNLLRML